MSRDFGRECDRLDVRALAVLTCRRPEQARGEFSALKPIGNAVAEGIASPMRNPRTGRNAGARPASGLSSLVS